MLDLTLTDLIIKAAWNLNLVCYAYMYKATMFIGCVYYVSCLLAKVMSLFDNTVITVVPEVVTESICMTEQWG